MKASLTRAAAFCALLATTALASPALAQATLTPAYRNLDSNSVDLTHGDFIIAFPEGSIGSGEGELQLLRRRGGSEGSQWDGTRLNKSLSGGVTTVNVLLDHHKEVFTGTYPNFTSTKANGSTLTISNGEYIYTASDGRVVRFGDPTGAGTSSTTTFCSGGSQSNCSLMPLSITEPGGKTTTIEWDIKSYCQMNPDESCTYTYYHRIGAVSNSFGYRIKFNHDQQTILANVRPTTDWWKRISAHFINTAVSTSPQATTSYAYPSTSLTEITDTGGRVWQLSVAAGIWGIRRPGAATDTTTYNFGANGVTSVVRDGVTTSYARTISGSTATTTVTDALNGQRVVTSNMTIGRPISDKDPLNRTTSYQYDTSGRLTRVTAPEGNYVQYSHDARGNVTETRAVAKASSGLANIVGTAAYPATCTNAKTCNKPTSTTDARGFTTDYAYDAAHGALTSVTAPAPTSGAVRPQTRYAYTLSNGEYLLTSVSACQTQASCTGTADEVKTTIAYDANGNATSVSSGDGAGTLTATTAMTYDAVGNLLTSDGPLAGTADTARYRYNGARQPVGSVSPDPDGAGALKHRAVRTTYNAAGLPEKIENGTVNSQSDADWAAFTSLEAVETGYDANARPVTQKLVAGGATHALTQTSYDALGRPECTAQRMNPSAFASLPASACSLGTAGSFGSDRVAKTVYDAASQVITVQTGYGTVDQRNEVTNIYANNGQLLSVTDAENNKTSYEYDGHDRLSKTIYPSPTKGAGTSNAADYEQRGYDAGSNVTQRRLRDGILINFSYDALGRLTLKDLPGSEPDVTYGYDNLGRMVSASQPGHAISFGYDSLGRQVTETGPLGTVGSLYDLAGHRIRITHPDAEYWNLFRDTEGRLTAVKEWDSDELAVFAYDDLGRRTSTIWFNGNGTSTSYGYDAVSRSTSLTQDFPGASSDLTLGFSYSPASQIVSNTRSNGLYAWTSHGNGTTSSTANGLNQLTAQGSVTPAYDARGNMVSDGAASYVYDSRNRLVSSTAGGVTTTLSYDPLDRLSAVSGPSGTTRFAYDGPAMISEHNGAGTILRRYVHGDAVDEPLVWYGDGVRRYFHADERGSIVALSNDAGNVTAVNRYDEYGTPASANAGRFQYTGQAWIPEIGLHHYKARMYNPRLGRFMQTDTLGYIDGMNLYAYVGNDPVNNTDPSGTELVVVGCRSGWTCYKPGNQLTGTAYPMEHPVMEPYYFGGGGGGGAAPEQGTQPQNDDGPEIVVNSNCNATCRANLREQERIKWVMWEGRYLQNPYYNDPVPWLNLKNFLGVQLAAGAVAASPGIPLLTARGTGLLNSNNVLRYGFNWKGSATDGAQVFRMSIGHRSWPEIPGLPKFPWHIP